MDHVLEANKALLLPSLANIFSLFPFAMATLWCDRSPALKRVRFVIWFSTSLDNFFGLVISASNSFIGRFMKAELVGANTVQGPCK